ncbi:hypothetical protein ACJW30_06G151400 [Castanea mollissima]
MEQCPAHVLIFPFPVQGHVNLMLKVAELLGLAGFHVFESLNLKTKLLLREMLMAPNQLSFKSVPFVTYIVVDGIIGGFTSDIANELLIPIIYFRTTNACILWTHFFFLISLKLDMDRLVTSVPGMESFLRCRDLPSFCRFVYALILNTFEDLERPVLSHIHTRCSKVYSIGPLHTHLKFRLEAKVPPFQSQSLNSLFEVDMSCMTLLDAQPLKSVIHVSFGSITVLSRDKLMEFCYVAQKDGEGQVPMELVEGTKDRGYIVNWAPQEEVLAHEAIGGIWVGVPMICWPYFGDQQVNSKYVNEVWKLGLDMKDVCDKVIIEKMVNDLMVERREEFMRSTNEMARLAKESLSEGGY